MNKYAFTFKPNREVTEMMGPFDSYEEMRKVIIWLAHYDDAGMDQIIENSLFIEHDLEYLEGLLNIHIYCVDEMEFTSKDFGNVCDEWRKAIEEKNKRYEHLCEEREREVYERLRKKFGNE